MKRAANRRPIEPVTGDCGKRCYLNREDAARLAKRCRRNADHKVEAYHCTACHAWHIGGVRPKQKILNGKRQAVQP